MPIQIKANRVPHLGLGWGEQLDNALEQGVLQRLMADVRTEYDRGTVFPRWEDIFRAFLLTPFEKVRVVILGQDPYHGEGEAHGLSFSVPAGTKFPPSLRNIFKELQRDLGLSPPLFGDLELWARQGVLLLNTCLTVRKDEAGSHARIGWEQFTDRVIARLSDQRHGIIFLLWGAHAQKKEALIDTDRHFILKAPHPSPLSAYRGFIGCGHFSRVNMILQEQGEDPIDWALP